MKEWSCPWFLWVSGKGCLQSPAYEQWEELHSSLLPHPLGPSCLAKLWRPGLTVPLFVVGFSSGAYWPAPRPPQSHPSYQLHGGTVVFLISRSLPYLQIISIAIFFLILVASHPTQAFFLLTCTLLLATQRENSHLFPLEKTSLSHK